MDFLFILISIAVITVLIVIHEFGHFLAAKYYGFQTPIFGIGLPFGPHIDLFKKWGTQFRFYFALIGGFVSIPELGDESNTESIEEELPDLKPLQTFPVHQRMVVASGGIVFNILFAFLLAVVMAASIGLPKGISNTTVTEFIGENSNAEQIGLLPGDKIISLGAAALSNGNDLRAALEETNGTKTTLSFIRPQKTEEEKYDYKNGQKITIDFESQASLGILLGSEKTYQKVAANPISWIIESAKFTFETFMAMLFSVLGILLSLINKIISLVVPQLAQASPELGQVKGIVGIIQLISEDIQNNGIMILEFAILLSLNLAVINLLPIPALDGGHLAFMTYEAVMGKKASDKFQNVAIQAGLLFIVSIMLLTTFNDIKNWLFP